MQKRQGSREKAFHEYSAKKVLSHPMPGMERITLDAMRRKIHRLELTLAQREEEVWTLKQLLLYR